MATDIGELLVKLSADLKSLDSGLKQAKGDLAGFQNYASSFGASIKKALTFTVGILGVSALIGELKSLASGVIEVGSKLQTMKLAAYAVGQNFGYTPGVIDSFVQDLKKVKISSTDAYESVSQFASKGLDPGQLQSIGQAARDLAVAAGKSPQEMFNLLIDSIVTGTPRALRQAKIPIKEFQDTVLAEGKSLDDNLKLSAQERSQVMIDLILKYAKTVEGVSESTKGAYSRQLGQIKYMSTEAKEALWDFMEPLLTAITGEKIKVWSDLLGWLKANRDELKEWGTTAGEFVKQIWEVVSSVVKWTVENGSLLRSLVELAVAFKLAGYLMTLGVALQTVGAAAAASGSMAMGAVAGWTAMAGSIKLAAIALAGYAIYKTFKEPGQLTGPTSSGDPFADVAGGARDKDLTSQKSSKLTVLTEQQKFQNYTAAEKQKEVDAAIAKWNKDFGDKPVSGKGGGGKAAKETADSLLAPLLAMYKTKREVELQEAQNSLDLLKTTNAAKRAELEQNLATGLIDGQVYYQRLQDLQQQETAGALDMIARKRDAQKKAYQESLTEVAADTKLSDAAKSIALQKLAAENRKALAKLDAESAQVPLEAAKKLTEELTRQLEIKRQYTQSTAQLEIDNAQMMGQITEQEATVRKLYLDWVEAKRQAFQAGVFNPLSPSYVPGAEAALDKNKEAKQGQALYGGYASAITSGISSMVDALMSGGQDLKKAANSMFKSLFNEALKPGLEALKNALTSGFTSVFGAAGGAIASAVMGVIGLVGMLLTSGGGKKSFTSSGVQSNVTGHEAVRGIIGGETSIPIAEISVSLSEAMAPHLGVLRQIEANTRGGGGAAQVNVNYQGTQEKRATTRESMETYFREYLLQGAR